MLTFYAPYNGGSGGRCAGRVKTSIIAILLHEVCIFFLPRRIIEIFPLLNALVFPLDIVIYSICMHEW